MQIAIVLYPGFTALDAIGPYEVLRLLPGAELRFVSHRPEPILADSGVLLIGASHSFDETSKPDLILVPGSSSDTTSAMADKKLLQWLRQSHEHTRLTLSVCSGSLILAAAGILDGRPATSHWLVQDALKPFGATPQPDKRIVKTGKIITAAGVSAGIDLALHVAEELSGRVRAEMIQLAIEYDPQPPIDSGHPCKATKEVYRATKAEMMKEVITPRLFSAIPLILWQLALQKLRKGTAITSAKP